MNQTASHQDADEDEPLTLAEACTLIFRNTITPATLRIEADRGRLVLEKVGRRLFVTRRAIREMRRKCQMAPNPKARVFGSNLSGRDLAGPLPPPPGTSETTVASSAAYHSALTSVEALKKHSKDTSPKNIRSLPANVVPING